MFGTGSLALIGLGFTFTSTPRPDQLLRDGRVFEFRDDALTMKSPSRYYRGALAYAFHNWTEAERDLLDFTSSAPFWSRQAFTAAGMLEWIYSLSGRASAAHSAYDALGWRSASWDIGEYRIREKHGDFAVAARGYSRVHYAETDDCIYIPLSIGGRPANYLIDSGSSQSFMSQSEAERLGLTVDPYSVEVQGYSDGQQVTGIAVAPELTIGQFRFRNVTFFIESDDDLDGGIIGLPVLLALETLRWGPDGILEIGFPAQTLNLREANVALARGSLILRAAFGNDQLDLFLDTGSNSTEFYPRFRKQYQEYLRLFGHPDSVTVHGDDIDRSATTLPVLPLQISRSELFVRPAHVLSRNPEPADSRWHGSLGMDFLNLAATVTLDFRAMRLTTEGDGMIREEKGDQVNCTFPSGLSCPTGWTCTVYDGTRNCRLERLPDAPWPGNPVGGDKREGGHQLEPGFHIEKGRSVTIGFRREAAK